MAKVIAPTRNPLRYKKCVFELGGKMRSMNSLEVKVIDVCRK